MEAMIALGIMAFFYFLPTIIACGREHNEAGAILVLNALLGWTFVFWVACLAWACTSNVRAKSEATA